MNVEQVESEMLKLPRHERARLAELLISSLDEETEIDAAWDREADDRYQRYLRGEERAIPASEALTRVRADQEK